MKREATVVVLAFTCLSVIATFPLVRHLGRALPADLGDPLFTTWVLGWDADRLRHGLHGFWNAPILFPSRGATAFSEHMLGIAFLTAPIAWVSGNPVLAYDLAFILSYALAGAGAYLLTRELTGRRDAAALGGLVFAFSPMRALHVSHLQVLVWGWMPIALWGLHRYLSRRSTFALTVFAAAFTIQALSNGYFLYFLALAAVCVAAFELASRPPEERRRAARGLTGASVAIVACMTPIAFAYFSVRRQYGFRRPYEDWTMFSADVRSYLSVTPDVHLWAGWLHGDTAPERQLFPGLVAIVCSIAALWPGRGRRPVALVYAGIAGLAFALSLGPQPSAWGHTIASTGPYLWLVRIVPGMDGLRAPARLSVVVLLAASALTAIGAARLLARTSLELRRVVVAVLAMMIFLEGWAAPLRMAAFDPRGRADDRVAYRWLAQQPEGGVIELPILEWAIAPTLTYQYATLMHRHPIVNGYSGYGSPLQQFLGGAASPLKDVEHLDQAVELLRAVGVRYVVIHPGDYADPRVGDDTLQALRGVGSAASEQFRSAAVSAFRLRDAGPAAEAATAPSGRRLPAAEFHVEVSDGADRAALLVDNDPETRWLTGRPQAGDEWIRIAFDRARDVSRVELQVTSRSFGDYPRELTVDAIDERGVNTTLFHAPMLIPFGRAVATGAAQPTLTVSLPPNQTRMLMIRQTGRARRWFWSVHELAIVER